MKHDMYWRRIKTTVVMKAIFEVKRVWQPSDAMAALFLVVCVNSLSLNLAHRARHMLPCNDMQPLRVREPDSAYCARPRAFLIEWLRASGAHCHPTQSRSSSQHLWPSASLTWRLLNYWERLDVNGFSDENTRNGVA